MSSDTNFISPVANALSLPLLDPVLSPLDQTTLPIACDGSHNADEISDKVHDMTSFISDHATSYAGVSVEINARVAHVAVYDGGPELASALHTHVASRDLSAAQSVDVGEGPAGNDRLNAEAVNLPVHAETMPVFAETEPVYDASGIHDVQSNVSRAGQSVNNEVSDSARSDVPRPDEATSGKLNAPGVATAAGQEAPPAATSTRPSADGESNTKARRAPPATKHGDGKVGLSQVRRCEIANDRVGFVQITKGQARQKGYTKRIPKRGLTAAPFEVKRQEYIRIEA